MFTVLKKDRRVILDKISILEKLEYRTFISLNTMDTERNRVNLCQLTQNLLEFNVSFVSFDTSFHNFTWYFFLKL